MKRSFLLLFLFSTFSLHAQQINWINPNNGFQGQSLSVTISGTNIDFGSFSQLSSISSFRFSQFSSVNMFYGIPTSTSGNSLYGDVQIQSTQNTGWYDLEVWDYALNQWIILNSAFSVSLTTSTIHEVSITNLEVFPNPSRDAFNVTFISETIQNLKVRILNVVGEELVNEELRKFVGEYTKQINLNTYTKGIYLLEIETDNGIINKKLILQ